MNTAYTTPARPGSVSEKSDPGDYSVRAQIAAHFALRRSSLRQWAAAWARTHSTPGGRHFRPQAVYTSTRMMIARHVEGDTYPRPGSLGARLWADLSAEVGAAILPPLPAPLKRVA